MSDIAPLALLAAALVGIVACSTPSARRIGIRISSPQESPYRPTSERYEDEDGTATLESEAAYTYQIPRLLVLLFSVLGALASLVLMLITVRKQRSIRAVEQWLLLGAWVCSDDPRQRRHRLIHASGFSHHSSNCAVHRATVHSTLPTVAVRCPIQCFPVNRNNRQRGDQMVFFPGYAKAEGFGPALDCASVNRISCSDHHLQFRAKTTGCVQGREGRGPKIDDVDTGETRFLMVQSLVALRR